MNAQDLFKEIQSSEKWQNTPEDFRTLLKLVVDENHRISAENQILRKLRAVNPEEDRLAIADHLCILQRQIFAKSSEKRPNARDIKKQDKKERKKSGPRVGLPSLRYPNAPLVEERIDFEQAPDCVCCGSEMKRMGAQTENSETITVKEKTYFIKRQMRQKYRCGKCYSSVQTAPAPDRIKAGGQYSDELAVDVAVAKYADYLPVERYAEQMKRADMDIRPSTLIEQTHHLASFLEPVYKSIEERVKSEAVPLMDETRWRMLEGDETTSWQMWGFFSPKLALYRAESTRSGDIVREFLKDSDVEIIVSDGYSGYVSPAKEAGVANAFCHAHARRYFIDAEENYGDQAKPIIELYGRLFEVERDLKEQPPDERLASRIERSTPIWNEIKKELLTIRVLPNSAIGRARDYILKRIDGFELFLKDGRVPLDNNLSERQLRAPVLCRKNSLGSHSKRGAKTTATLFSVIQSCRMNGVNPQRYLLDTVKAMHEKKTWVTPDRYTVKTG